MDNLSKKHRLGRCKTAQWMWDSFDAPFDCVPPHDVSNEGAIICVISKNEIIKFRSKGYDVTILTKVSSSFLHDVSSHNRKKPRARRILYKKKRKKELLERFVVLIKKQAEIAKELDDIRAELAALLPEDDERPPVFNLFQPFVDEDKLSDCFNYIFQKFFGTLPTERLEGYYAKPIDLIAYMFILVEWERLGNCIFSEKCKKPFFEYINEKVLVEKIGKTERTFYNRLTLTMNDFRNNLMKEPASSKFKGECWKRDFFIKDFLKVLGIFHGTDYYKELEMRKHA